MLLSSERTYIFFAVPNFKEFCSAIVRIFEETKHVVTDGELPNYIPELAKIDPNYFAVSFCTVDGQLFGYGDTGVDFSLQSAVLPLTYLKSCEQVGIAKVSIMAAVLFLLLNQ